MRDRNLLSNAAALLICGLLAGVVVAAAAFPAVAFTGLAAKAGSDSFESLPSDLKIVPPHQNSYIYAADGKTLLTTFYDENRRYVPIDTIAPVMRKAIVAAEDNRFYEHHGVDVKGVLRAFVANRQAGDVQQGASTLTMQYVRNVLIDSARTPEEIQLATEQTPARKLREMRFAVAVEKRMSKDQILERYLNIAFFGHGAYGVYAAAQVYFSKAPKDLTLAEAGMLAGLVKSPSAYDPASGTPQATKAATERRSYVLSRMVAMRFIAEKDAATANKTPIALKLRRTPNDCVSVPAGHNDWGFFCDYFKEWWVHQDAFGATTQERLDRLRRGGYNIVTSLNPKVQAAARKHILEETGIQDHNAISMAVVQPGTGRVQAMAVNRVYSLDSRHNGENSDPAKQAKGIKGTYPNTVNLLISGGGDVNGYQIGSTAKMFTMLAALSRGMPLDTSFNAPARLTTQYREFDTSSKARCADNRWCPSNANPTWMDGKRSMWDGFGRSVNTYFVWLIQQIGAENAVKMAQNLGIQFRSNQDQDLATPGGQFEPHEWGAFTLGVAAITPLDLANAYATVAADGKYCEPLPVVSITDVSGKKLDVANPHCRQAVTADVARAAADAARCPVGGQGYYGKCNGGTAPFNGDSLVGRPFAGKTGTTDNTATATFVGFTPQFAAAAIAADPDRPTRVVGNAYADMVDYAVAKTIRDASSGLPVKNFGKPSQGVAYGVKVAIPDVTCNSVTQAKSKLTKAGFKPYVVTGQVGSRCGAGTVAFTDPRGTGNKGGPVSIYVSNGRPETSRSPKPPNKPKPPGGGGGGGPGPPECHEFFCPPPR